MSLPYFSTAFDDDVAEIDWRPGTRGREGRRFVRFLDSTEDDDFGPFGYLERLAREQQRQQRLAATATAEGDNDDEDDEEEEFKEGDGEEVAVPVPEGFTLDIETHVQLDDESMGAVGDAEVVEGWNEGFKCPISLRLMVEPVELDCENRHVFDKSSISRFEASALGASHKCPVCRSRYTSSREVPSLRRIIATTVVRRCPHCNEVFNSGDIMEHVQSRCPEALVHCTFDMCGVKCKRKDVEEHRRSSCRGVPLPCINQGCPRRLSRRVMGAHVRYCDYAETTCEDCSQVHKRGEAKAHGEVCEQKMVECDLCHVRVKRTGLLEHMSDASLLGPHMMGMMGLQQQMKTAKEENSRLREQLEALSGRRGRRSGGFGGSGRDGSSGGMDKGVKRRREETSPSRAQGPGGGGSSRARTAAVEIGVRPVGEREVVVPMTLSTSDDDSDDNEERGADSGAEGARLAISSDDENSGREQEGGARTTENLDVDALWEMVMVHDSPTRRSDGATTTSSSTSPPRQRQRPEAAATTSSSSLAARASAAAVAEALSSVSTAVERGDLWTCSSCLFQNDRPFEIRCEICQALRHPSSISRRNYEPLGPPTRDASRRWPPRSLDDSDIGYGRAPPLLSTRDMSSRTLSSPPPPLVPSPLASSTATAPPHTTSSSASSSNSNDANTTTGNDSSDSSNLRQEQQPAASTTSGSGSSSGSTSDYVNTNDSGRTTTTGTTTTSSSSTSRYSASWLSRLTRG